MLHDGGSSPGARQGRARGHMRKLLRNKGLIRGVWEGRFPPPMRREIQREKENGGGFGLGLGKSLPMMFSRNDSAKKDGHNQGFRHDKDAAPSRSSSDTLDGKRPLKGNLALI